MAANVSVWSFIAISAFTFGGAGLGVGGWVRRRGEGAQQKEKEGKGGGEVVNTESGLDPRRLRWVEAKKSKKFGPETSDSPR